jgi:hypothetical protein
MKIKIGCLISTIYSADIIQKLIYSPHVYTITLFLYIFHRGFVLIRVCITQECRVHYTAVYYLCIFQSNIRRITYVYYVRRQDPVYRNAGQYL